MISKLIVSVGYLLLLVSASFASAAVVDIFTGTHSDLFGYAVDIMLVGAALVVVGKG